jgi:carboxypeptidase Taq
MMEKITDLKTRLKKIATLESILEFLEWDQQVNLPKGSIGMRSIQMSAMTEIIHRENTADSMGALLETLAEAAGDFSVDDKVVFEDAQIKYNRLKRIPESFASRKAESQSESYQKWTEARKAGDFMMFAPYLKEHIELCKEEAAYVGSHESAYEYMIDHFDRGMDIETIDALFRPLASELSTLLRALMEKQPTDKVPVLKGFPLEPQKAFLTQVITAIGFDFDHGRIDESLHPFCLGKGQDIRMTTRFFEDNPVDSLYSSIHETGHALYEQGLPVEEFGNALGSYAGMAAHESQSRLWENQVGRSEVFWRFWEKRYRALFPTAMAGISLDQWMLEILKIKCIPIRVDSDEVTYNLHIFIRYELEKALFDGSLPVEDLPGAWNDLYEKYLGIRPRNDSEGVLQDVHWSGGAFGYFPSYTLGNIMSAQLWDSLNQTHPGIEDEIANGQYGTILNWLRCNIHAHGRRYTTQELVRVATGQTLSEKPLLNYLKTKYFGFYGIE